MVKISTGYYTEYNNSNLKDMYINTPSDLNRYWDNIRRIIITAAKSNIDNHMTSVQHKDTTPEHLMESYRPIKRLNRLLSYVSPKSFPHNSNEIKNGQNFNRILIRNTTIPISKIYTLILPQI